MIKNKLIYSIAVILTVLISLGAAGYSLLPEPEPEQRGDYRPTYLSADTEMNQTIAGETAAHKNETVYVLLDHTGNVVSQSIVNRIYDQEDPEAGLIVDYGFYSSLENLTAPDQPLVEQDKIIWNSNTLASADIYYEGQTAKDFPLEITISYMLDGQAVDPAGLVGQDGRLELVLHFKNNLAYTEAYPYTNYEGDITYVEEENYVPLLVQGSIDLDLNRFSEIDPGEGLNLVMGQVASINFMVFPYPEAEIKISMTGKNIELNRFSLMVTPQLPGMPEVDMENILIQMLEGLQLFSGNFGDLLSGAQQILDGLARIRDESANFTGSADQLGDMLNQYKNERQQIAALISSTNTEELMTYFEQLKFLIGQIDQIPDPQDPLDQLDRLIDEVASINRLQAAADHHLSGLERSSNRIIAEAEILIATNEPGSALHELGLLLLNREAELATATAESRQATAGLTGLQSGLTNFRTEWSHNYLPGLAALEELTALIPAEGLDDQLASLLHEIEGLEYNLSEVDQLFLDAETLLADLEQLPKVLERLVTGQKQLAQGLELIAGDGFASMESELIKGIDETRAGKAKLDLMEKLADDYRSYADNQRNRYSEVRFIIQTPQLEIPQVSEQNSATDPEMIEPGWAENIWLKLITLFE